MRAYCFTNFYLSSLAKGIQAAHCLVDMGQKYGPQHGERYYNYCDWANQHKTIIVLNGGNCGCLREITELFESLDFQDVDLGYPWASFREDDESLNGALTCVSVVLPEKVYGLAHAVRSKMMEMPTLDDGKWEVYIPSLDATHILTKKDIEIAELLNSCSLAN